MSEDQINVAENKLLYEEFKSASTLKIIRSSFAKLCKQLGVDHQEESPFYPRFRDALQNVWQAKELFKHVDKRANMEEYEQGKACSGVKSLVVGAGPCGLRVAVELALLGARVVLVEKRDVFARNNVLHLWPFTVDDLAQLGAKKLYRQFCTGGLDHISIRQLQLILLKLCLMVGVEVHVNTEFVGLVEPTADKKHGWRASWKPDNHAVSAYEFDVLIEAGGAGGKRLDGFKVKECRGQLAIGVTANFVNRKTKEEIAAKEISGVASIYNQNLFNELHEATGISLENIVYYKGDTHYFVMTAKKQSLLEKKVLKQDQKDADKLLSPENVNKEALQKFALEAANYSTDNSLPRLDFARNGRGDADVAVFDFTCMRQGEHSSLVREVHGTRLLLGLVGDSLLEPFWPLGTGCARGFLAAFDMAWMVVGWAKGKPPLKLLAERESVFKLLAQTSSNNIKSSTKNFSINPAMRYTNLNLNACRPQQVAPLYIGQKKSQGADKALKKTEEPIPAESVCDPARPKPVPALRRDKLIRWCQECTRGYPGVNITDLTTSWQDGLALCALIHRFHPDLIEFIKLDAENAVENNRQAFEVAERELGIAPITTAEEMGCQDGGPDLLAMVAYLTRFYNLLGNTPPPTAAISRKRTTIKSNSPLVLASKLRQTFYKRRKSLEGSRRNAVRKPKRGEETPNKDAIGADTSSQTKDNVKPVPAIRKKLPSTSSQAGATQDDDSGEPQPPQQSSIERSSSSQKTLRREPQSSVCFFCEQHVYVLQRLSAEGKFFHRECFRCSHCEAALHLGDFAFDDEEEKFYCKPHFCFRKSPTFSTRKRMFEKMRQTVKISLDNKKKKKESEKSAEESKEKSQAELEKPSEQKPLQGTVKNEENLPAGGDRLTPEQSQPEDENSVGQGSVEKTTKAEENAKPDVPHRPDTSVTEEPQGKDKDTVPGSEDAADDVEQPKKSKSIWKRFKRMFRSRSLTDLRDHQKIHDKSVCSDNEQDDQVNGDKEAKLPRRFSMRGTRKRLRRTLSLPSRPSVRRSEVHAGMSGASSRKPPWKAVESDSLDAVKQSVRDAQEPPKETRPPGEEPQLPARPTPPPKPPRNLSLASPTSPRIKEAESRDAAARNDAEEHANAVPRKVEVVADVCKPLHIPADDDEQEKKKKPLSVSPPRSERDAEEKNGVKLGAGKLLEEEGSSAWKQSARQSASGLRRKNATRSKIFLNQDSAEMDVLPPDVKEEEASSLSHQDSDSMGTSESGDEREDKRPKRRLTKMERQHRMSVLQSVRSSRHHEQQRLNKAQMMQRELQELEEKQRILEEEGVKIEKTLRGDGVDNDNPVLMQEWFKLIGERNLLLRKESEIVIMMQELELEDRQGRLQQRLDTLSALNASDYDEEEQQELDRLLQEKIEVVEQRNTLVSLLEEQRLLEKEEDKQLSETLGMPN
ncbi:F-actin-monooxygenase MICAL3-like isoform X1 [Lethenteron reissneri]|uniref:F-actin-monooxygenase MICAL3-like isoform X1 n=1 Tax=Lethenteron reissneri TaxID=7753 RepID=UPI002AB73F08|nr:F-actin-monooxygenase MICAL3-like isoform X1 [Lethenteron reissneri]XP_061422808.1 F-actin-monooxygenase MICAL3-like isoform X1 [Lethenteron reissneri]XP_061422809.1 F-actin-monooxygenase MICAL3-like isoform X1 [Lethenteron reissneri]